MSAGWIDGHCHLTDPRLKTTLERVLESSRGAGITGWVQGGVSPEDWNRQLELQARLGRQAFFTSFGLHPWWVARSSREEIELGLQTLSARLPLADGAGELGLDATDKHARHIVQQEWAFREQLALAKQARKPLVLHIVRAHAQAIETLAKSGPYPAGGLVHSFASTIENAKAYIEMGFFLSISGAVTRSGFQRLKKTLDWLPSERLVLETDSPDQPPAGTEGLNEPRRLLEVARAVGAIRRESPEELLASSSENLRKLFGVASKRKFIR